MSSNHRLLGAKSSKLTKSAELAKLATSAYVADELRVSLKRIQGVTMFEVRIPAPQPKYPDRISTCAPRGMRAQIQRAADVEKVTAADFIRQALEERVRTVLDQGLAHD